MSLNNVKEYFNNQGLLDRIIEFNESSATVELAARAVGCEPARIAKTLSFHIKEGVILIVTAGDAKIDNKKYKQYFGQKAKMLSAEEVEGLIGHGVGGVCPFAIKEGVKVFLDDSLKRFSIVYPAAGSGNSAVKLFIEELEQHSSYTAWIDVCKI